MLIGQFGDRITDTNHRPSTFHLFGDAVQRCAAHPQYLPWRIVSWAWFTELKFAHKKRW
jgi:hypothetical protein